MTTLWKKSMSRFAQAPGTIASAQESTLEKLHIYNRIDEPIGKTTLADFQKLTGIKLVYEVVDKTLKHYDLLMGPDILPIEAGRFQKLDKSLLPNWKNLDPLLIKHLESESEDPGNQYLAPYLWEIEGIIYNPEKVKAALGIDKIDSWNVLFEPENIKKLSQYGVALPIDPSMIRTMLAYLGFDPNSTDLDDYKKAEEKFIQISKHVTEFRGPLYNAASVAKGDICITTGSSYSVMEAANRASEAGNGIKVHFAIPKEGANLRFEAMGIPVDALNTKIAHAFINYLLDPEVIAKISNSLGYANPNLAAREFMDKYLVEMLYPPQAVLDKSYISIYLPENIGREKRASWKRIMKSAK